MKRFLFIIFILCFVLTGCTNFQNGSNVDNSSQYITSRTSTDNEFNDNNNNNEIDLQKESAKGKPSDESNSEPIENEISSFSTKIYTPDDEARQTNIGITCSKLNETIVEPGQIFSFCETVGKATPEEGYQKADIFDKNGNTIKGYGGGNCQISSTLYNAVLALPSLTVVERHEHSKEVYYVPLGKDAAVAYGSIDFKFKNDYDYKIKIYCSNTRDSIDVRIVKI